MRTVSHPSPLMSMGGVLPKPKWVKRSLTLCVLIGIEAECEKLMELYERLEELDADKAEVRASRILHGLGFTAAMQQKKLKDFSGGWRMRVALAR